MSKKNRNHFTKFMSFLPVALLLIVFALLLSSGCSAPSEELGATWPITEPSGGLCADDCEAARQKRLAYCLLIHQCQEPDAPCLISRARCFERVAREDASCRDGCGLDSSGAECNEQVWQEIGRCLQMTGDHDFCHQVPPLECLNEQPAE